MTTPKPPFDAILVPGGGLRHAAIPPWVENRLQRALDLAAAAIPILCLSAGTTHRPLPLDPHGRPIFESVAAARWLLDRGFPAHLLFAEAASYDTIGNAYFARTLHTDPAAWRRLAIITSQFHMPRTEAIFRWIFLAPPIPAPPCHLTFLPVPDRGLDPTALAARLRKERQSLQALAPLAARCPTLPDIHRWLFTEHRAYAAAPHDPSPTPNPDPTLLQSY